MLLITFTRIMAGAILASVLQRNLRQLSQAELVLVFAQTAGTPTLSVKRRAIRTVEARTIRASSVVASERSAISTSFFHREPSLLRKP
jgi:hypothetical protein